MTDPHPLKAAPTLRDEPDLPDLVARIQAEELSHTPGPDRLRAADVLVIRS